MTRQKKTRMAAVHVRMAAVWFALGALALAATVSTEVRAQALPVEPATIQLLQRMTDYLGSLQQFSLDTQNTFEEVLESGQKIQFDLSASVVVQRPNKLRAERKGDLISQFVVYDGKTLTIYNSADKYYAVADAPDTIEDTLHFARDSLDIVPPSGDLVYQNAFDLLTANVTSGMVVGKSMIGGVKCDHLAFSGPVVDWQIWIADGDQPLPRNLAPWYGGGCPARRVHPDARRRRGVLPLRRQLLPRGIPGKPTCLRDGEAVSR